MKHTRFRFTKLKNNSFILIREFVANKFKAYENIIKF